MEEALRIWEERLAEWGIPLQGRREHPWGWEVALDKEVAIVHPRLWPGPPMLQPFEAYARAHLLGVLSTLGPVYHAHRRKVWHVLQGEGILFWEPTPLPKPWRGEIEVGPLRMARLQPQAMLHLPTWSLHALLPHPPKGIVLAEVWIHDPRRPTSEEDEFYP